jgi:hypothetical protein
VEIYNYLQQQTITLPQPGPASNDGLRLPALVRETTNETGGN